MNRCALSQPQLFAKVYLFPLYAKVLNIVTNSHRKPKWLVAGECSLEDNRRVEKKREERLCVSATAMTA